MSLYPSYRSSRITKAVSSTNGYSAHEIPKRRLLKLLDRRHTHTMLRSCSIELLLTLQLHVWDLCSPLAVIFEMFGFCEVYAHIHTFLWLYSVLGMEVDFGDAAFPILSETFNDHAEVAGFLSQQRESCPDEVLAIIYSRNYWPLWIPNCTLSAFQAEIPPKKTPDKDDPMTFFGAPT